MTTLRDVVESGDPAGFEALLADDVSFRSPVAYAAYEGKPMVAAIVRGAFRVFKDFEYVRELKGDDGRDHALVFKAVVDGRKVEGCDFLRYDENGLITEFTVMMRPLSAVEAMAEAMSIEFEAIKAELTA